MLDQYYRINKVTGLSIRIQADGSIWFDACEISAGGNQLDFGAKRTNLADIDELGKYFAAGSLIALNLLGKGVLTRQIEKLEIIAQSDFSRIFPNANMDDFYVQNFISGEQSFISIIRKTDADQWITRLTSLGFKPMMLSLGFFPVQQVLPQLNVYGGEISLDNHVIERNVDQEWTAIHYLEGASAEFNLKIENEPIDEKLVIAYAVAFQLILASKLNLIHAPVAVLEKNYRAQLDDARLKVYGVLTLLFCFTLLLLNFVLFSWLNAANAKMATQVSLTSQSASDRNALTAQVTEKELLLKSIGWERAVYKSKLIDQISALLPAELRLHEVTIDPIDGSAAGGQRSLSFLDRKISIIGSSDKIIPVNEWLARIKTLAWVKKLELKSYTYNSELNTGTFTIAIDY